MQFSFWGKIFDFLPLLKAIILRFCSPDFLSPVLLRFRLSRVLVCRLCFICFNVVLLSNVVFVVVGRRTCSRFQASSRSGRLCGLTFECRLCCWPLGGRHLCGRPVVHLMSSLPLVQLSQPRRSDISVVGRV